MRKNLQIEYCSEYLIEHNKVTLNNILRKNMINNYIVVINSNSLKYRFSNR